MMLLGKLYHIISEEKDSPAVFEVEFDIHHPIFQGHFPHQPVVPGVCMTHMCKELAERCIDKKLNLQKGDNLKFLNFIDPNKHPKVKVTLLFKGTQTENYQLDAQIAAEGVVFFKFQGVLGS